MLRGLTTLALILPMIACSVNSFETAAYDRVASKDDFLSRVVDKKLVLVKSVNAGAVGSVLYINSDGTISGALWPSPVSGTWEWQSGKYCSEVVVGDMRLPRECKNAWVSGSFLRLPSRLDPTQYAYYEIR